MKREVIKFKDQNKLLEILNENSDFYLDDDINWEFITEESDSYDSEKGFLSYEVIVKRVSDGKFFKGRYTNYGQGHKESNDKQLKEVFPKKITTTIYK